MLLVDSHQDLAWNILTFGRDYRRAAEETRRREAGSDAPLVNGDTLLGWPDYQSGQVGVIFATLFAAPIRRRHGAWDTQCYESSAEARRLYRSQLDAYHRLCEADPDYFRLVAARQDLADVCQHWEDATAEAHPVGLVVLMEGAEGVEDPAELEEWWRLGLRLIGPAWAGTRFCGGTREPGPLTPEGFALLERMAEFGFALDISHMDEKAVLQALDIYPRAVVASHSNALTLLKGSESNRHLTDRVIQGLIERDGVIGVLPFNNFLRLGWQEDGGREAVSLDHLVAHIDLICQMAGNARHAALGSDFDGGFGVQSVPAEIDTIADLQKLAPRLSERGYSPADIAAIFSGNWLRMLDQILPEVV